MTGPALNADYLADEATVVARLLAAAAWSPGQGEAVSAQAATWVRAVRGLAEQQSPLDALLREYDLSTQEGVLLMCVAEALLRIPDEDTAEKLIADKLGGANWQAHLGRSESVFVNASTWGLMLTGKIIRPQAEGDAVSGLRRLVNRSGEPVIRLALRHAMRMMGGQFVMGQSIASALRRAGRQRQSGDRYSFDMLGEAALNQADADHYFQAYAQAIAAVGKAAGDSDPVAAPSISVKLSALHPRYHYAQAQRVNAELTPRLLELAQLARAQNIGLTVDAEEADRLQLSLGIVHAVYRDRGLSGWDGLGLAVQAYQKRAPAVLDLLADWVRETRRSIPVRLVKGAYWDSEIKLAQELGLPGYPVFTRKCATDVSYLACARRLQQHGGALQAQFATHNAHTIAAVLSLYAGSSLPEFQRLHGMGVALYEVIRRDHPDLPVRIYAPVGSHESLLPYLVRRLLENGANTSFVNRIFDEEVAEEALVADPLAQLTQAQPKPSPRIALPLALYPDRLNSQGLNLAASEVAEQAQATVAWGSRAPVCATPLVAPELRPEAEQPVHDPGAPGRVIGHWRAAPVESVDGVLHAARHAAPGWEGRAPEDRARILERAAELLENRRDEFLYWLTREAGKTIADGIAEVREAADFCRYYAVQIRLLARRHQLPGPTGEDNSLSLHGRGVFVCISPWNFPLAIFVGQVAAALVTGNAVVAKPAEQTNIVAWRAVQLLHEAGVPREVLQLVLGSGESLGPALTRDERVAGVVFTGSVEVAQTINRQLAARPGAIASLIAETGGLNAMLVDSSALPEQVVKDVMQSAFGSAGQRCSALRVLFVQEDVAEPILRALAGAVQELCLGDPGLLSTDLGPVIDATAREDLLAHIARMSERASPVVGGALPEGAGHFVAPCVFELKSLDDLPGEVFGPILHVIRYAADELDGVIDAINARGFGLTLGVQSRIESTWRHIHKRLRVGNCYINRSMTGAVVGVQPFGGEGLSGTGPKAGGPHYLQRFMTERTLTVNTTAIGGNASLLAMQAETPDGP